MQALGFGECWQPERASHIVQPCAVLACRSQRVCGDISEVFLASAM